MDIPLRLDNAKGVAHMPTAGAAKNKSFEPRFKIDHAASPMPETKQPERLAPRATSNRNEGRDHLGILGEIIGIRRLRAAPVRSHRPARLAAVILGHYPTKAPLDLASRRGDPAMEVQHLLKLVRQAAKNFRFDVSERRGRIWSERVKSLTIY